MTLWLCQCDALGRGMLNCIVTPFLEKHDTRVFSSQHGTGPALHQDLRVTESCRAHNWDTVRVSQVPGIRTGFKPSCKSGLSWVNVFPWQIHRQTVKY